MTAQRRRGRPPIAPGMPSFEISVSFPECDVQTLAAIARSERVSEQTIIRKAVAKFLRDRQRPPRARSRRSVTRPTRIGL